MRVPDEQPQRGLVVLGLYVVTAAVCLFGAYLAWGLMLGAVLGGFLVSGLAVPFAAFATKPVGDQGERR